MEFAEWYQGDTGKLYEKLNLQLANENAFLRQQIQDLKELNTLLLSRLGIRERIETEIQNFEPVGGYTPLRQRIANAELKSRQDADQITESIPVDERGE